eukprot:Skav216518  [mRNA]  locus=scaffold4485:69945:70436:- [translate_table: standard]
MSPQRRSWLTCCHLMYLEYERVFGKNERPQKDMEPTSDQLSAIVHLLQSGLSPYTDFAIWGPYGRSIDRKLKQPGVSTGRDGVLRTVEIQGLPNIANWPASYTVLLTALVMTKAVHPSITKYRTQVERLHDHYGPKVWAMVWQTFDFGWSCWNASGDSVLLNT